MESIVATIEEGKELIRQLRVYDGIENPDFGRLYFKLDVDGLSVRDAWELIDRINDIDSTISVFIDTDLTVTFDYYVTLDLVRLMRSIVNEYVGVGCACLDWEFPTDYSNPA